MLDVIDGRVDHKAANATVRTAESLIKIAVKQVEYGSDPNRDLQVRDFQLCSPAAGNDDKETDRDD